MKMKSIKPVQEKLTDDNTSKTPPDGEITPWVCKKCGFNNTYGNSIQCYACGYCKSE